MEARFAEARQQIVAARSDLDAHHEAAAALLATYPELSEYGRLAGAGEPARAYRAIEGVTTAWIDFVDELERAADTPKALEVWQSGVYLPALLTPDGFTRQTLHSIMGQHRTMADSEKVNGIIERMRAPVEAWRDTIAERHAGALVELRAKLGDIGGEGR